MSLGCLGSLNIIHSLPGSPTTGWSDRGVFRWHWLGSVALQSHLDAFSGVLVMFLGALPRLPPVMSSTLWALWSECPTNPLPDVHTWSASSRGPPPISPPMAPLAPWWWCSSWPLRQRYCISGLKVMLTMCWGNLSCFSRSTKSCQSWGSGRIPAATFLGPGFGFSPAFTKVIALVVLHARLQLLVLLLMASGIGFSSWLWRQVYPPSPRAQKKTTGKFLCNCDHLGETM